MGIDRKQFGASDRPFFTALDRWQAKGGGRSHHPNIYADAQSAAELDAKRARHRDLIVGALAKARADIDIRQDWDRIQYPVFEKMQNAALYYLYIRDRKALVPAVEALEALEQCSRPYWSFSSCIGVLDMDLRTAEACLSLAMMKCCLGDILPADVSKRLSAVMVSRCLRPGLEAERNKTYPWMVSRANWRIILCGCFAIGGMAFAEEFPDYPELLEYGLEAMLTCFATGDREGGWNEGPGYWDYGLGYALRFATALRIFTGGAVDLYRHRFLRKTGDFRLYMQTRADQLWNWSDVEKKTGPSQTLMMLARAYGNPFYQWRALGLGVNSIQQVFVYDTFLKPVAPPAEVSRKFFPGSGVLAWRNGFGRRDTFVGIMAGDIPHFNHHCHMDFGNLVIHAGGRELLAELDKWTYPYEGRKDPKDKRNKPGYYDMENKRWMRWDFDVVSATGHNGVVLEGAFPQPAIGLKGRFLRREAGAGYDIAVVDSTVAYRPLATRVRRYVVMLWPDTLVLVDEIRARKPVRARVQFHPADAVKVGVDSFIFTHGSACLRGTSLFPQARDQMVLGLDDRQTSYLPPEGLAMQRNRYVYIENLCRKPRLVFVSVLQFGIKGMDAARYTLQGAPASEDQFTVGVKRGRRTLEVAFDLAQGGVGVHR